MSVIEEATEPGAFLADFLPISEYPLFVTRRFTVNYDSVVKYIPSWFPFAEFKRFAEQGRKQNDELRERPFEFVRSQMVSSIVW